MRKLLLMLAIFPLRADSFLTTPQFPPLEGTRVGPWDQDMVHDLMYGEYLDTRPESLVCHAQDVIDALRTRDILTHMYVLQTSCFLILEGFLNSDSVMDALRHRAEHGGPLELFDWGFGLVLMDADTAGLGYLARAVDQLGAPEARLGYALSLCQIAQFSGSWDSPNPYFCKAVGQLLLASDQIESWSPRLRAAVESAMSYMQLYGGPAGCPGWDELMDRLGW